MGIKDKFYVDRITYDDCKDWCLKKHYAKKMPSVINFAFGLFDENNILQGVCIFGLAGNSNLNSLEGFPILELTRLVLNDHSEKNLTSFFVSQCLSKIDFTGYVISFADSNFNHNGYIYQATNFLYTGLSNITQVYSNGKEEMHSKTFSDKYGRRDREFAESIGFKIIEKKPKHRYFYIKTNNKTQKKELLKKLLLHYSLHPYPKGENITYDASYQPTIQGRLF